MQFASFLSTLAVLVAEAAGQYNCQGGAAPVAVYNCGRSRNCCAAVAPACPQATACQVQPQQNTACCCPQAQPIAPPQPVMIPVVTVMVPPGAPCPLPAQQCGGGSSCQYTLNLAVCTCPNGQSACNGVCQQGNACGGQVSMPQQNSQCVIGAGDWCGPPSSPRCNCVQGATCGPHVGAGIYLCLCNQGLWRRGKACLPY